MMKFFFNLIIFITFSFSVFAATGDADTYTVTMKKVELCTSSACSSPTVVASGSQAVDIASLSAGSDAASFGSTTGLPMGTTFTHLRVTIDRTFTISGTVTDGANTCSTDGSTEANATTLHVGALNSTGSKADTTFYLVDAGTYNSAITISYSSPSSAVSMSVGSPSTSEVQLIYKLTDSYAVGLVAPKIKVIFDVEDAVGGANVGGTCRMWPEEPIVTLSLTE